MEPTNLQAQSNYTHFVTFTLQPQLNGKGCRQQLRQTWKKANYELQRVCKSYHLVAELTKKCNIHYHAIIEFDINQFFSADELNLILQDNVKQSNVFGRFDTELIKSIENTTNYITKDLEKTNKIINPRGKTPLDYKIEWYKGLIKIDDVKITRLKNYLKIDDNIDDTEDTTWLDLMDDQSSKKRFNLSLNELKKQFKK